MECNLQLRKNKRKNGIDESNVDMSTFWNGILTVEGLILGALLN